ncbi:MAG: shikimate kinase [Acholeplasmatales bacterium]|nr:shikimate kinase [Acholeplasmatales bacterium]
MRIYLIGMPGSGKSTLGKKLAKAINYEFIDMDNYIEKKACMFIEEIFDAYGEEYFRELEKNTLKEFLELDNVIISTGGGIIKNKANKELMDGKCIFLNVDLDELQKRCDNSSTVRPLLQIKTIKELYAERKDLYDYFKDIEVDNMDIDKALNDILEELK